MHPPHCIWTIRFFEKSGTNSLYHNKHSCWETIRGTVYKSINVLATVSLTLPRQVSIGLLCKCFVNLRPNSQSTYRRFDQNVSVTNSLNFEISSELRKHFQNFAKNPNSQRMKSDHLKLYFQTKMTNSDKMNRFLPGFSATEFSRFLLVSNCLNSAKKSKLTLVA